MKLEVLIPIAPLDATVRYVLIHRAPLAHGAAALAFAIALLALVLVRAPYTTSSLPAV